MNYIASYCKVREYTVYHNSECVFKNDHNDIRLFLEQCYEKFQLNYPKYFKMDVLSKLGIVAAEILLKETLPMYKNDQVAVILSNAHSSLDTDLNYRNSMRTLPSPALFVYTLPNIVVGEICIKHKLKGENEFFVFDKFNPSFLVNYTEQLLAESSAEACLTGWIDVIGEQHDVFLYLVEKNKRDNSVEHTSATLTNLYK